MNLRYFFIFFIFLDLYILNFAAKPRILLLEPWFFNQRNGLFQNNLYQNKFFNEYGYFLLTLTSKDSLSAEILQKNNLPFDVFLNAHLNLKNLTLPLSIVQSETLRVCKKNNINIVITPRWEDVKNLIELKKKIPIKVILARHASVEQDKSYNPLILKGLDGFVGGNADISKFVSENNEKLNLNIKKIVSITPFWDENDCLEFSSSQDRETYYLRKYGVKCGKYPIITTLAVLYNPCKNHPLLFKAIAKLIHKEKILIHAMIAGDGPLKVTLEELSERYSIKEYVHFLGEVENPQELLYHSDIHVLPSYYESFSVANLEAACMRKPIIMAKNISASQFIQDGHNGLLFNNNDENDLMDKIEYLVNNPQHGYRMGENGYKTVRLYYSNDLIRKKWDEFLSELMDDNEL